MTLKKNPFLIFVLIITILVTGALIFIQSRQFANVFKRAAYKYLPRDMGIEADFSEFAIQMFPPGISLKNPALTLREHNALQLPEGSAVRADRIDLIFQPFQMFTGKIRVHEVLIVNGDVRLKYDPQSTGLSPTSTKDKAKDAARKALSFSWDELFHVNAEAVGMQDTRIRVDWVGSNQTAELEVKSLRFGQWLGKGGLGYELSMDLSRLTGTPLDEFPALRALKRAQLLAHVNAAGAQLETFSIQGEGLDVSGEAAVKGDVLNPKSGLGIDGKIHASGDFAQIVGAIDPKLNDLKAGGAFQYTGRIRGNLEKIRETLRLDGALEVADFRLRRFQADKLEAVGNWASSPDGGGEAALEKVTVFANERDRSLGQTAVGGKIQIGSIRYKIGSSEPISAKINLEHAQLQWLASMGLTELKQVYPLLAKITGTIDVEARPPSASRPRKSDDFELKAQLKLGLDDFVLDNMKIDKKRTNPLKIFNVRKIGLEGSVRVDSKGLKVDGVTMSMEKTQLRLTGSIGKGGLDLHANGPADLADLGQVAEREIHGDGTANILVSGPSEKIMVDMDMELKNASYLNLHFGDLLGRLTWDDDANHLIFRNVRATRGQTHYVVDGFLDLGQQEKINLMASVPSGNVQDFIQVFRDLTKNLSWFPQSLTGPMSGDIKITGGLDLDELQAMAHVTGTSWDYMGERFTQVALSGGYDRGKYLISDFKGTKKTGKISGHISYDDHGERFDWDLHSQQLTVSDFDHVARLDVPIRAKLNVDSTGHGRLGSIQASTEISATDTFVRGVPMPPSHLSITSQGGVQKVKGAALGSEGVLDLVYDYNPVNVSTLRVDLKRLDFSPILLLLNPKSIPDTSLTGLASGSVNLSFHANQFERATGDVAVNEYILAKSGTRFQLSHPVALRMTDGSFDLNDLSMQGRQGEAHLKLTGRKAQLEGRVSGDMDLSFVEFLTSSISRASGTVALDVGIGGTIKTPLLSGAARPKGTTFWIDGLESPFENTAGTIQIKQSTIEARGMQADLAGGTVRGSGTIRLFTDRFPELDFKADFADNKLKVFPFQFVKVTGSMTITGSQVPYLVEGDFKIDSALSKEKVLQQKQGTGLKVALYTPPPSQQRLGDFPLFKLKIDAKGDRGILVQNDLFDAEVKAQVQVVNTIEAPRILGNVDLIQGKMIFKDRAFQIQSASAVFDNPAVINPKFDMTARTDINGTKVQLYASGALDNYKIDLTSTPSMPESEILSLLAIGLTPNDTKRMSSADRSAFEQGEAASLLLHSLDFNREVENKTGIQIQLDESVNNQIGTSVFRPQNTVDSSTAPKIVIKRRITKNVDVSYGSTVGVGTSSNHEVNAEVKVTPGVSIIGVWDNYETQDIQDKRTNSSSYGLDFKFQKRFR